MQLVDKTDLLPPGICTLCELSPADGAAVVDTLHDLLLEFPFKLGGRKYVCGACINALGGVVGLVSSEQEQKAITRAESAERRLQAVNDYVLGVAKTLAAGVETVVPAEPKKPVKKAASAELDIEEWPVEGFSIEELASAETALDAPA